MLSSREFTGAYGSQSSQQLNLGKINGLKRTLYSSAVVYINREGHEKYLIKRTLINNVQADDIRVDGILIQP